MRNRPLSWKTIYIAATCAANESMRQENKKTWGTRQYEIAAETVNKLYKEMIFEKYNKS